MKKCVGKNNYKSSISYKSYSGHMHHFFLEGNTWGVKIQIQIYDISSIIKLPVAIVEKSLTIYRHGIHFVQVTIIRFSLCEGGSK